MDTADLISRREVLMLVALVAALCLNVADAAFTLYWVYGGLAYEANPLMAALIAHPALFVSTKVVLVSGGLLVLWRLRDQTLSWVAMGLACTAYYLVLLYHLTALPALP